MAKPRCMKCEGELTPIITWVHEDQPKTRHHPEPPSDAFYWISPNLIRETYLSEAALLVGKTYSEAGLAPPD